MKKLLLFLTLIVCSHQGWSRFNYSRQIYTANDGLSGSQCFKVFQDSRDFLWIGTSSGLNRFDGKKFIHYTPADGLTGANVSEITEDRKGNIWVATSGGLFKYDGIRFRKIGTFGEVRDVAYFKDRIWIASRQGLYSWDGKRSLQYHERHGLLSENITCLHPIGTSQLLIGTSKGLNVLDDRIRTFWRPVSEGYIRGITTDHERQVWFATMSGNVYLSRNGTVSQVFCDTTHSDMPRNLLTSRKNEVLVARERGFNVFSNGRYQGDWSGMSGDYTEGFMNAIQDREGNYWIAANYGLICLRPLQISGYRAPATVFGLFRTENDTSVYISDGTFLYRFLEDTIVNMFPDKPYQDSGVEYFAKGSDGSYLFGTRLAGIMRYKQGHYEILSDKTLWSFYNHKGTQYFGADDEMILYKDGALQGIKKRAPKTGSPIRINSIYVNDAGVIFVGTQGGLSTWNNGIYTRLPLPVKEERLLVAAIAPYKDNSLLLGTRGYGLLHVRQKGDSLQLLDVLDNKRGLGSNYINEILVAHDKIFLSTMNGIYKIKGDLSHPLVEYISSADGLPENSWSHGPVVSDNRGYIYVGGSRGLSRFHKDSAFTSHIRQKTYITNIVVNNNDFAWNIADSNLSFTGIPEAFSFKYDDNSPTFNFTGINFYKPSRIKYQYLLEGYKPDTMTGTSQFMSYNNLPSGTYRFMVRSTTNQQFTNEPFAVFRFHIKAPFWETYWFRLSMGLLFIAGAYSFYRWRLQAAARQQEQQLATARQLNESKILAFQARMNPHFIFNSLNAIQYFILNNEKHATLTYLTKFARLLRQILDNSIESKINLEKEIEMLRSYIEMEELRFDHSFHFEITIADDIVPSAIDIPGMIIQPFVENAIIHGLLHKKEEGSLKIDFTRSEKQIICVVTDNGIGREESARLNAAKATNHQSHGTKIAINRLELLNDSGRGLNNTVDFIDLHTNGAPSGTRVIIRIPVYESI